MSGPSVRRCLSPLDVLGPCGVIDVQGTEKHDEKMDVKRNGARVRMLLMDGANHNVVVTVTLNTTLPHRSSHRQRPTKSRYIMLRSEGASNPLLRQANDVAHPRNTWST